MVVATVLSRTRLSANGIVATVGRAARASLHGRPHASHDVVVGMAGGLRVATRGEGGVERFALHLAHHVGRVEIAAVGDGGGEIGYLQWRGVHLALPDADGDDGQSVPGAVVVLVVELGIGNQSALLARQVDAQFVAESHRSHIVAPCVHGILHVRILLAVAHHVVESPAEVAVARCRDGRHQRQW